MLTLLKYIALVPCLLLSLLTLLASFLLGVPLADIGFEKLALAALQIIFYGLASWELLKNRFQSATIYSALAAVIYLVSAIYDLGGITSFTANVMPVFYIGLALRLTITGLCAFLTYRVKKQSGP